MPSICAFFRASLRHCAVYVFVKIKTLIFVAVACFVNANSAFANFIDPSKPTREDEASESALAYAGQLVLAFFDHYFNKRQAIDSDALEFTIIRFTPEKHADDLDYDKMTKFSRNSEGIGSARSSISSLRSMGAASRSSASSNLCLSCRSFSARLRLFT
jgi:hypothetical protein